MTRVQNTHDTEDEEAPVADVVWFETIGMADLPEVGGKNASLGEMTRALAGAGVRVPGGFATTATAWRAFLAAGGLGERIAQAVAGMDPADVAGLARTGALVRGWVMAQPLPGSLEAGVRDAYARLAADALGASWAVRSSATAEDLPDASFAGQQETYLNVSGIENILEAVRSVFASLYNDRAIAYRAHQGYDATPIAISAGVQRMVRSDIGAAGVMFTVDTESGFDQAVFLTSSYGLGEAVVQGAVSPDEFYLHKPALRAGRPAVLARRLGDKAVAIRYTHEGPATTAFHDVPRAERARFSLTDPQAEELGRCALAIEDHYGRPMDIEWALDGTDGLIYILQARPETVASRAGTAVSRRYTLHGAGQILATGRAVGQKIGSGPARVLKGVEAMASFQDGDVLVADITDPDWEPVMKKAAAIVTNRGGRTCHAAIIARELGIPAVVGTRDATRTLKTGTEVTVSCADGDDGHVYAGILDYTLEETRLDQLPDLPVKIMANLATPEKAFALSRTPNQGVGLARLEFIINRQIGIHPRALIEHDTLPADLQAEIDRRTAAYPTPTDYFTMRLAEGIATIAAAFHPKPVIVRMSDFKSNEYANLLGGSLYEPDEENPMIGWRGAARYATDEYRACFDLECRALIHARDHIGLTNITIMIPFVRTPQEGQAVIDLLAQNGLVKGRDGLEVIMMCEIPSNALRADEFLDIFDGYSIGSNDLTQLTLGIDRDSQLVAEHFDERDPAVLALIEMAIQACNRRGKYVGICGQGPSDHPDLARWLLEKGIQSISLNPDTIVETWTRLAQPAPTAEGGRA